jgi:hypothetical protein
MKKDQEPPLLMLVDEQSFGDDELVPVLLQFDGVQGLKIESNITLNEDDGFIGACSGSLSWVVTSSFTIPGIEAADNAQQLFRAIVLSHAAEQRKASFVVTPRSFSGDWH